MATPPKLVSGKQKAPPRIMIYGEEGIGKSSFAAGAPNMIFIHTEDGLGQIDCIHYERVARTYDEVMERLEWVRDGEHEFQTVAVDSLDWLERLIWARVCADYGVRSIEKADGGYGRGYNHAAAYWKDFLDRLTEIRDKRNMAVILTAHAKVEHFEDPEHPAYDRYSPRLHKAACSMVREWVDAVLFATHRMRYDSETGRATPIGADGGERIIRANGAPACIAKNRFGITGEIPLSWSAFMAAIPANT